MLLTESKPALAKNISPVLVTSILCLIIIALTLWEIKKKVYFKAMDIVLFSLVAILSLLIIYLWFSLITISLNTTSIFYGLILCLFIFSSDYENHLLTCYGLLLLVLQFLCCFLKHYLKRLI